MNVVEFAHQVLDMQSRIHELEREVAELRDYRERYDALLQDSLNHNQRMMTNMLEVCMTPGVLTAMKAHQESGGYKSSLAAQIESVESDSRPYGDH